MPKRSLLPLLAVLSTAALVNAQTPVQSTPAPNLSWGDFDRDGLEDVYVGHPSTPDRLLRNEGDGSFEDVTLLAGLGENSATRSAAWGDYDGDGWLDLFVSSRLGAGRVLRNLRGACFEDRTQDAGLADIRGALDVRWLDYDADGFLDLVLAGDGGSRLLHNCANGTFEQVSLEAWLNPPAAETAAIAPRSLSTRAFVASDRAHEVTQDSANSGPGSARRPVPWVADEGLAPVSAGTTTGSTTGGTLSATAGISVGGSVPRGSMILDPSQAALPGYSLTGLSLTADPVPVLSPRASMPTARWLLAAAAVNDKVYAIGGTNGLSTLSVVQEYNPATNAWSPKTSSVQRQGHAAAEVGGKIYVIGGDTGSTVLITVNEYNPATNFWSPKASIPLGRTRLAAAAASGKIYAIGGSNGTSSFATVQEYDPATNAWSTRASMPTARQELAAVTVSGKIYAIGGIDGFNVYGTVEEYDPAANIWTSKAPMPTARHGLAAVAVDGKIYAIGGGFFSLEFGIVEEYDPATDSWSTSPITLTARKYLAAAVALDKIYAVGGDDGSALATAEEIDLGQSQLLYLHRKN